MTILNHIANIGEISINECGCGIILRVLIEIVMIKNTISQNVILDLGLHSGCCDPIVSCMIMRCGTIRDSR